MKYCPNCGSDLKEGAKFCAACGYKIAGYTAGSSPLPEKEIFPEPGSKKNEDFGFEASSEKSNKYDPFSDPAPKYSDYTDSKSPFSDDTTYGAGTGSDSGTRSSGSGYESDYDVRPEINGYAIAALVLGIVALIFDFLVFIPSVLAVIFGIVGLKRSEDTGTGRGMSIAGIVLGIIAFSIYLVLIICAVAFTGALISL